MTKSVTADELLQIRSPPLDLKPPKLYTQKVVLDVWTRPPLSQRGYILLDIELWMWFLMSNVV